MYQIEDIQKIVSDVVKLLKPYDMKVNTRSGKCEWKDVPEFWKGYKKSLKFMKDIKVHAEIGDFPDDLFAVRAPNQTDAEANYIKANYKQNTLPVFMDYISTMSRPFFDGNWSINYQTEKWNDSLVAAGETLQDYVEADITSVGSIENFMKQVVVQTKAIDANGVIAVKINTVKYAEVDGQLVVDNSELFEPSPVYYSSEKIYAKKEDEYYLINTDDYSTVTYGSQPKEIGHVFEFYDDTNIWRIVQKGNFVDYTFDYFLLMEHGWNRIPVMELQGVPQIIDSKNMIWISPFHYAVPNLNNALMKTQYLNASEAKVMFPHVVMLGRPCEFEKTWEDGQISKCIDGHIFNPNTGSNIDCPSCGGFGLKDRLTPFGEMRINPGSEFNQGENKTTQPPLQFVSPATDSLEFVREGIFMDMEAARKMLHQQTSNSVVKGTENLTATGMSLDTKAMFSFVKTVSDQMFAIYEFLLDSIGWMRYGPDYIKAIVISPISFDYNTDQDYLIQIADAQKAGLPPFVIHAIIFRYLQTLYYNEKERANVFSLIINTDRLLTLSQENIMMKYNRGLCFDWEVVIHDSSVNLIGELLLNNNNYLMQDFKTQQDQLIALAKTKPATQTLLRNTNPVQAALEGGASQDNLGKLPLAMQQLGLAKQRALETNDAALAKRIGDKMDDLLKQI